MEVGHHPPSVYIIIHSSLPRGNARAKAKRNPTSISISYLCQYFPIRSALATESAINISTDGCACSTSGSGKAGSDTFRLHSVNLRCRRIVLREPDCFLVKHHLLGSMQRVTIFVDGVYTTLLSFARALEAKYGQSLFLQAATTISWSF